MGRGNLDLFLRLVICRSCLIFLFEQNILKILCVQPVAISWGNLPFSHLLKVLIIQPGQQCEQMLVISIIYLVLITILYCLFVWAQIGSSCSCAPDVPSPACNSWCLCPQELSGSWIQLAWQGHNVPPRIWEPHPGVQQIPPALLWWYVGSTRGSI